MLERKVDKKPLLLSHGCVESLLNRRSGESARDEIGSKGSWSAPEHVARKLVQDDYRAEQRAWCDDIGTIMCHKLFVQRQEAFSDLRIDVVASREPMIFCQLLEPEADDIAAPGRFDIFCLRWDGGHHFSDRDRTFPELPYTYAGPCKPAPLSASTKAGRSTDRSPARA